MRYIKLINEYNTDEIYKHYQDVDKKVFDRITKVPKKTIFIKWLLNLYKENKFKIEDMEKADIYLSIFNKPNVFPKLGGLNTINKLDSIQDLHTLIKPFNKVEYLNKEDKDEFIKDECFIKEFKNYDLYIPKTHEESKFLGKGTQWCTAADSEESSKTFDEYIKEGKLFIFINKNVDIHTKYQIHIRKAQFMDEDDNSATDTFDYQNNMDIINFFMNEYYDGSANMTVEDIKEESDDTDSDKLFQIFNIAYIYQYYSDCDLIYHDYNHYDSMQVTYSYHIDITDTGELYDDIIKMFDNSVDISLDTKLEDITLDFLLQNGKYIYVNSMLGNNLPKYDGYTYMKTTKDTTVKDLFDWLYL